MIEPKEPLLKPQEEKATAPPPPPAEEEVVVLTLRKKLAFVVSGIFVALAVVRLVYRWNQCTPIDLCWLYFYQSMACIVHADSTEWRIMHGIICIVAIVTAVYLSVNDDKPLYPGL